eukprot:c28447_g5_i1 orf=168-2123(-)
MGTICSRIPSEYNSDITADGQHAVVNYAFSSVPVNLPPPRVPVTEEKDPSDLFFRFESEERLEKASTDEQKKKALSRLLSEKARTARSRTTLAARKGAAKVNGVGSFLGKAGTAGLGRAVEALDTLGSSMTHLNLGSGFASGPIPKGNKIGILAFEVANTIVKGFNLKQSLSDERVRILKEEILQSEGVQSLVSTDMSELLRIAAVDKRNELKIFSGEVVRFGNHCRDPQWHQLDRFFEKMGSEVMVPRQTKEEVESDMQNLMVLAQYTAELYHNWHVLDRFEIDYHHKVQEEEFFGSSEKGERLAILRNELKSQRKHLKNLKKRSLWSKILEEVMENLVDIVYFLYQEIQNVFGDAVQDLTAREESSKGSSLQKLGAVGMALHYANIINQIDSLVSRPTSVPSHIRDNLYQGLPPKIKAALRYRLETCPFQEELTVPQIKAEMEKTLSWLVPVAANTTKSHHGFGWVGEWANSGSSLDHRFSGNAELTLLQTLHHADQQATEECIMELIVWLHHLIIHARNNASDNKSLIKSPIRSPIQQMKNPSYLVKSIEMENGQLVSLTPKLSPEDQEMIKDVKNKKFTPGLSRSQEFDAKAKANHSNRLSKSNSHSPITSTGGEVPPARCHAPTFTRNFEIHRLKSLDVMDRLDNI